MIPTEPIGSLPRTESLQAALRARSEGRLTEAELAGAFSGAVQDALRDLAETGSPVISDGEQSKPSFLTYPLSGLANLSAEGVVIPFADGHTRQLPALSSGPFRYATRASTYLKEAQRWTERPVKQAVISASALSLLYPQSEIPGYPREAFLRDLVEEAEADIRSCLLAGAHCVQIDFTEARLSLKLDPSGELLRTFVRLNNQVLERFTREERRRIGVHVCPGGDHDSTHSADVDYAGLLPELFQMNVQNFYVQLSSERDRAKVLAMLGELVQGEQRVFIGVTDPIARAVETPEQICDLIVEAARYIDPIRLGTTDDCGFSPFADDTSTARQLALEKIRARVLGTQMASAVLGL